MYTYLIIVVEKTIADNRATIIEQITADSFYYAFCQMSERYPSKDYIYIQITLIPEL